MKFYVLVGDTNGLSIAGNYTCTSILQEVNGWYYLLTEDVGKKKHLEVASRSKGSLRLRGR